MLKRFIEAESEFFPAHEVSKPEAFDGARLNYSYSMVISFLHGISEELAASALRGTQLWDFGTF